MTWKAAPRASFLCQKKKVARHEGNLHYAINPRKIQFNKTGETHLQVKGQNWDAPRKQQEKNLLYYNLFCLICIYVTTAV